MLVNFLTDHYEAVSELWFASTAPIQSEP